MRVCWAFISRLAPYAETHCTTSKVGGALLAALPPAPLRPDALARTLARLDDTVTAPEQPPAPTDLAGLATGRW
jgi:hypothetical protein